MSIAEHPNLRAVRCPQCGFALAAESWQGAETVQCVKCQSALFGRVYPAIGKPVEAAATGERALDGDSVCFFHPGKKAALSCERCGRFVCELCDMPLGARHLCPACIESGLGTEKLPELVTRRTCWSRIALGLAILPILLGFLFPLWLITGPTAIILALYGWNKPGSLVHGRRRVTAVISIVLGLLQIVGAVAIFYSIWNSQPHA